MSLSSSEESNIKDAFFLVDRSGKGIINEKDTVMVLRYLGVFISEEEIHKKGTHFNLEQVRQFYIENLKNKRSKGDLQSALEFIFKDNNGTFNIEELKHGLSTLGENFTKDEINKILTQLGIDTTGEVSIEEFVSKVFDTK